MSAKMFCTTCNRVKKHVKCCESMCLDWMCTTCYIYTKCTTCDHIACEVCTGFMRADSEDEEEGIYEPICEECYRSFKTKNKYTR